MTDDTEREAIRKTNEALSRVFLAPKRKIRVIKHPCPKCGRRAPGPRVLCLFCRHGR